MLRTIAIAMTCLTASLAAMPADAATAHSAPAAGLAAPNKHGYLAVNGVDYYYEVRGHGEPLLLLHGGLGSIDMLAPQMARLASGRQVIAVDLQGHGRTGLGTRPFSLEAMG